MRMDIFQFRGYGADYSVDETVLYFECLSRDHRAFLRLPPDPRYSFKPKFDIEKLFKPERIEEAKKILTEKQIRALQQEVYRLEEIEIPNMKLRIGELKDRLEKEYGPRD
tara:strand:- start:262 stop:591 length:330 start_codon:yes stop_codon:yes gene_type:complete